MFVSKTFTGPRIVKHLLVTVAVSVLVTIALEEVVATG